MADFNALETLINAYIKKNGVQAITGNILNGVLRGMVSALGKGYTVIGVATPSTDPGTMTGPCAYYASQAGTYTNFGGLVVNDGDVAMLIYDEQTWHKEVMFSLAAEASVDANVGTPWVNASFENGMLTFTFGNMKGNPGDAAGFGTVNATVDSNIGTPGVSVQTSGPDTAKNMTFQFTNLKGETGVTSVVATVDNTTGTPACAVSLNGQELHLDFTGLKGAQGNTGVSADYPITIVNNLTDGGAASALSAEMGKQLESEVSQLEAELNNLANTRYYGIFTSSADLPADASERGYAYVGTAAPFAIYEFDGNDWVDTGAVVNSIQGEPGVGLEDVESPSPADGTVVITLSNGDKMTLDLNHNHGQYTKAQLCEDKEEYDDIASKDPMTFYLIPGVAMYLGNTLILEQGNPLPYTPVAYIQTDGTAYINTGIKGNAPGSAEIKITPVTAGNFCYHLGCRAGTARFAPFTQWNASGQSYDNNLALSYATSDTLGTSIATALGNHTPLLAKTILKSSLQKLSVSQDNGTSWVDFTPSAGTTTITTSLNMFLGACNNDGTANRIAPSGTRYHYLKIYSDDSFTTLVFDGVPCKYNNEYGLWDKVSNTFFGNAAGSGAFSGPSNS